jgi:integrative and conjugative element protein (TIGR02256 family)
MHKLLVTRSSYELIKKESLDSQVETGGLLVGTLRIPIVLKATRAGPSAKKSGTSYTNDVDFDNATLNKAINQYKGKSKLVGYWHKHPDSMSYPSAIDLATAKTIVRRNEISDTRPVYFVITNTSDDEVRVFGYSLERSQSNFNPVCIRVIDDKSEEIIKALSIEPAIVELKEMDFWDENDFQFYLTRVGHSRLKQEIDKLMAEGYRVKVYTKDQLYIVIKKNSKTILCQPPPEYPLNPPRFFEGNNEIEYSIPIWNSSIGIIDIIKGFWERKDIKRSNHESTYFGPKHRLLKFTKQIGGAVRSLRFRKKT